MRETFVTSFKPPAFIQAIARLLGCRIISQDRLSDDGWKALSSVDMSIWAAAQREFRTAILAVRDGEDCGRMSACRVIGLTEKTCQLALAQFLSRSTLLPYSFVRTVGSALPESAVIVDFPPRFVRLLEKEGFVCNRRLSQMAWTVRRSVLQLKAVAAHVAHLLLGARDSVLPLLIPTPPERGIVLWLGVYPSEMESSSSASNVSDFVVRARHLFPHDPLVVIECANASRHDPSTIVVSQIFRTRRRRMSTTATSRRLILDQARLMRMAVLGDWKEATMATEIAKLPRARACLEDLKPQQIVVSVSSVQYIALWIALARDRGAAVNIVCNSTQVFPVKRRGEYDGRIATDAYLVPNVDEYLVWDQDHRSDIEATGVHQTKVRIAGPLVLSAAPSRSSSAVSADPVVKIDYFDQPPVSRAKLIRMGRPQVFHSLERTVDTLEALLATVSAVFAESTCIVRLKSKRPFTDQEDDLYGARIEELQRRYGNFVCVDPCTSPLSLHSDSNMTIGFPFVSPAVSAAASGIPSCFFDVVGDVETAGPLKHGLPVVRGQAALAAWLESVHTAQSGSCRTTPSRSTA